MTKRKKNSRQRGSKTHSWGAMKKHRGSGNRGGRGNAGSGKRSDCKKPSVWGIKHFYGDHGFTPVVQNDVSACNIEMLERKHKQLLAQGVIKEEKDSFVVDLQLLGCNKLLSKGNPTKKWDITAKYASEAAVQKVKEKGGSVTVSKQPVQPAA